MGDFWELQDKYGLFAMAYHIITINFRDIMRDLGPILIRFVELLGLETNKDDRNKLRGVMLCFADRKFKPKNGWGPWVQWAVTSGASLLEQLDLMDDKIRDNVHRVERETEYTTQQLTAANKTNQRKFKAKKEST